MENLIDQSFHLNFKTIIETADSIKALPSSPTKNDALLALAYAYLNQFQFKQCDETLVAMERPSDYQAGAMHEISGIKFISLQSYKKAILELQEAIKYYSVLKVKGPYYQACNNEAYALLYAGRKTEANILIDQVIDFARISKDSTLLSAAYVNKLIAYPEESEDIHKELTHFKTGAYRKTILYELSKSKRDPLLLQRANTELSNSFYNIPFPVQFNINEEIKITVIDHLIRQDPKKSILLLQQMLRDSVFLPLGIENRIHTKLSAAYNIIGMEDSSSAQLLMIKSTGEQSDTVKNNIPIAIASVPSQDKKKDVYLALVILFFAVTVVLLVKLLRIKKKK